MFEIKFYEIFGGFLPQVLIAIIANGGAFLYGVSLGWSAPSEQRLIHEENDFCMSESDFSWSVAIMPLGSALSCAFSGIIRNKFGTRTTILAFGFPNLVGYLLLIFGNNALMLLIGRLLIGIAGGAYCFNIPVFIGEIASAKIRGILLSMFKISFHSGITFVYILGPFVSFSMLNSVCGTLVIVFTISFMFLPESPIFLIHNDNPEEAEKALKIIHGPGHDPRIEIYQHQKKLFVRRASKPFEGPLIYEIKKKETIKAFLIIFSLFFLLQMSGINAVLFYSTEIFLESGIHMDPSLATIIVGIVQVVATIFSLFFVDRFGRVFLLICSFVPMIFGQVGFGVFFYIKNRQLFQLGDFEWLPILSLSIFLIGFSIGLGTVPFILLGEIFSDEAKRVIAPVSQTMNFIMSFAIGILYPPVAHAIGTDSAFFIFAGFCAIGLIFTIFCVPETKGKTLREIQLILQK